MEEEHQTLARKIRYLDMKLSVPISSIYKDDSHDHETHSSSS